MSIPDHNLTDAEINTRLWIGDQFCSKHRHILTAVQNHYSNQENKRATAKYAEILAWWFKDIPTVKVKGKEILLGDYEKDRWCYVINWTTGNTLSRYKVKLDEQELAVREEEYAKKEQKRFESKCKQFGINPKWKDKTLTNKDGEIIQFEGFSTKRKMPVKYKDLKTGDKMVCTIEYFKKFKLKKEEK